MIKLKTKVGQRGQIVIPKPVRETKHIKTGDTIYVTVEEEGILLQTRDEGKKIVEDFLNEFKPKLKKFRKIDWDKEYEDRFIKGLDLQFQGETLYLGANVFIYAAVRGDEKGEAAGKLIKAIASAEMGKNIAFTSTLVLDEVLWILTRRVDRIFAAREVKRILSFPNSELAELLKRWPNHCRS